MCQTSDVEDYLEPLSLTPTMATPMYPIELQELVIDSIHDEHHRLLAATLHSCCLTCRAWFPRSIRRLYRRLILSTPPRTQLDPLVELINTSPYVASAIEELVIGSVSRATKDSVGGVAIRAMLAGKLPRLRSMELVGSGSLVESSPPPLVVSSPLSRVPTLAGFPMLTTLRLSFVMFTSYVAFDRMLAAVPGLRRLSASYVICKYTRIPATFPDRRPRLPALSHVVWHVNSTSVSVPRTCDAPCSGG
ncbi:hypothetical protein K466DRAFT_324678 [Polyporus arcularius HHB13444]|uniref:F-box domain-containing protein n=1 Tax=Polyporus arcularius HHB13444 TaxID=1314778 RepID=A0A5C3PX93_9APHY|nr:hypothetical protein K466DRAFT_324678 [Polyporus arcularius HHB13444]